MATELMIAMAVKRDDEIGKPGIQPSPVDSRAILGETEEEPDPVMLGCGSRWFRRNRPDGWGELLDILGLPAGGPLTRWPDDPDSRAVRRACLEEARADQQRIEDEIEDAEIAARLAAHARKPAPRPRPAPRPSLEWMRRGLCVGDDIALYYGKDGERAQERQVREDVAVRSCTRCPVLTSCLNHALTMPERWGVWGGMGEDERAAHRRKLVRRGLLPTVDDSSRGDGKTCPHCGTFKPNSGYQYDRSRPDGLSYRCRTCLNTQRRGKQAVA